MYKYICCEFIILILITLAPSPSNTITINHSPHHFYLNWKRTHCSGKTIGMVALPACVLGYSLLCHDDDIDGDDDDDDDYVDDDDDVDNDI